MFLNCSDHYVDRHFADLFRFSQIKSKRACSISEDSSSCPWLVYFLINVSSCLSDSSGRFWLLFGRLFQIYSAFPELYSGELVTSHKASDLAPGWFPLFTNVTSMLPNIFLCFWTVLTIILTAIFADLFRFSWIKSKRACSISEDSSSCPRLVYFFRNFSLCLSDLSWFIWRVLTAFWPLFQIYSAFPGLYSAKCVTSQ